MNFLTAKSLPRRTVLRGLGATMALPLLEAMLPAISRKGQAAAKPVHRFQTFYVPNGMAMEYWSPKGEGSDFELSPILEPLAPFRNQMLVLSGIKANWNYIHAGASGSFLTGTTRGGRNEVEIIADVSMDQLLARRLRERDAGGIARAGDGSPGQRRRLHRQPELRLHPHDLVAQPDAAVADGVEPAGGVREAVRRQRQHGAGGAGSEVAAAEEHSGLGDGKAGGPQEGTRARRTRSRSMNTRRRFATSNGAFRRPRNSATSSCRRWSSLRACRRSSKITWR